MPQKTFAQWEAERKASAPAAVASSPIEDTAASLAPSGESMLGGMAGSAAGPGGAAIGSIIGSSVHALSDPLKKLLKIGVFGPVSSEGVGTEMLNAGKNLAVDTGLDLAKNTALNYAPGVLGKGAAKAGAALTKFGESGAANRPAFERGVVGAVLDPMLSQVGVPHGVTEAATVLAPPAARIAGPALTKVGNAMPNTVLSGLRSAVSAMKPGLPEVVPEPTPADLMRENVAGAREDVGAGFSRPVAAKLNKVPQSTAAPSMPDEPINTELFPYQSDAIQGLRDAAAQKANTGIWSSSVRDAAPNDPNSPIEQFYRENPQAKGSPEGDFLPGRTTGTCAACAASCV